MDGKLEEALWNSAEAVKLKPSERGIPENLSPTARVLLRGNYLCLGVVIPEPEGKVLAYSIGYNPKWEKNASTYFFDLERLLPPTEDRLISRIDLLTGGEVMSNLQIEINPWGAMRVERNHVPVPKTSTIAAASIDAEGWQVEAAVPLKELGLESSSQTLRLDLERVRSRRALAPEFRWESAKPFEFLLMPEVDPGDLRIQLPAASPSRPPLEVGRVQTLPALQSDWEDPFWKRVPSFQLARNESYPRRPRYPTTVKWVHDGKTLSVFFRCEEDTRVICNIQKRDDRIEADDHVCIYLATTGSSLVEILVNPAGAIKDQEGIRSNIYFDGVGEWRKKGYSYTNWSAEIQTHPLITKDSWYARIDVPLNEVARALGSDQFPQNWNVLLGRIRQKRLGEPEEVSCLPVIESSSFRAPARYRPLLFSDLAPDRIPAIRAEYSTDHLNGLAGELSELNPFVLSRLERRFRDVPNMLSRSVGRRVTALAMEEHEEWADVQTREDWEEYRDRRMNFLRASFGDFPETRTPLQMRVTGVYYGPGYQVQNLVYQSRPGVFVPANLYLPLKPEQQIPAIIINPGHGMPKTQEVNKDCGMIWARAGCAVLVPEKVGHGERIETLPWNMQAYYAEELHEMQLGLIGQSRQGWIAWDISRAVDLLLELGYVDPHKIILMGGATWGGGPTAATAGFLEDRLAATVIFNFGRVYWYTGGGWRLRDATTAKIPDWFFCASKAPRKFIYAHEFWFEGEEGPNYPSVWAPSWPRYEKVYGFYGALENLKNAQSDGLLRLDTGHCGSIDHLARREIYPILKTWFGIPLPTEEEQNIEIDSQYGTDRIDYPLIKHKEAERRMPDRELVCITPEVNAQLDRKPLHQIAFERGDELLQGARSKRSSMSPDSARLDLVEGLSEVLGDIAPTGSPRKENRWSRELSEGKVEALLVHTQEDTFVPLLLVMPRESEEGPIPLVIAVAEGGKERFLKNRSREIATLVRAGLAVCLPDLRGTGETAPEQYKTQSHYHLYDEIALGNTMVGLRLKDLRTLLAYLRTRDDLNADRIALWGDSFSPPNEQEIWVDELMRAPMSPQIQRCGSPLGSHVAILAALFEPEIRAVAVRGGLASYLSLLEDPFVYVPYDIAIPGLLRAGDIPDICAVLAPIPLFAERLTGGRNFVIEPESLRRIMSMVRDSYQRNGASNRLVLRSEDEQPDLTAWLIEQLTQ